MASVSDELLLAIFEDAIVARRTYMPGAVARTKDEIGITTTAQQPEHRVLGQAVEIAERFEFDRESVRERFRILMEMNEDAHRERR